MQMHKHLVKHTAIGLAAAIGLAGSFYAGVAFAADSQLDDANAHLVKAVALLKASENPNAKNPKTPFGGHRSRAIKLIEQAEKQIAEAKAYADNPRNQKGATPAPSASGHGHGHGQR